MSPPHQKTKLKRRFQDIWKSKLEKKTSWKHEKLEVRKTKTKTRPHAKPKLASEPYLVLLPSKARTTMKGSETLIGSYSSVLSPAVSA